jgi:hypothetical protein
MTILFFLSSSSFSSLIIINMGCCQSTEQVEEKQRNQEIDAQIKRDRVNMRKEIKMLLLGM